MRQASKHFFSEKKKQKTFGRLSGVYPAGSRQGVKVFWCFFSKKDCLLACLLLMSTSAHAAILRPYTQITAGTVHLADLFDNLGSTPDRVLGAAPSPGARITVASPQLAAIARDFNVDWRPQTGGERAVLERRGDLLPQARVSEALRRALAEDGAPELSDVVSPDIQPVLLPAGSAAEPSVSQLTYDPQGGHFTALVTVAVPDGEAVQMRVSGQVVAMAMAAIATSRLAPGHLVGDGDVRLARVRAAALRGAAAVVPEAAVGMSLRHDVPAGQVLSLADLVRPALVQRGALVRMSLESAGISLSAQGIAEEAGANGDRIRVENPLSHQIVLAEVTGAGEVRVAPRTPAATLVSAP